MKLYNVGYLENHDIDREGNILMNKITSKSSNSFGFKKNKHKKILVMVQANFCGHCTNAKPDFQKLAYKDNDVFWKIEQELEKYNLSQYHIEKIINDEEQEHHFTGNSEE